MASGVHVDPETIQMLLDQISPPDSITDILNRYQKSALPPPSGDLKQY